MQNIRTFEPNDMFSVIKLANNTLTETYNPSLFTYFYETYLQGFLVAEQNHKIIGFIVGVKITNESARILMLSVSPQHRRKNIGTNLLNKFIENIKMENIKEIHLEVRTDNEKAIRFYQKHNFEITDKIAGFYQNGEDAYIMKKRLF